jgi:hypothetical protein
VRTLFAKSRARRTRPALAAVLALALTFAGCGGKDGPTEPAQLTPEEFVAALPGSWHLTMINEFSLPVVVSQSGAPLLELLSDQLTVTTNGTSGSAGRVRVFRQTNSGGTTSNVTVTEAGTFTLSGATASFSFPGDAPTNTAPSAGTGTISANKLTIGAFGTNYIYVKQP